MKVVRLIVLVCLSAILIWSAHRLSQPQWTADTQFFYNQRDQIIPLDRENLVGQYLVRVPEEIRQVRVYFWLAENWRFLEGYEVTVSVRNEISNTRDATVHKFTLRRVGAQNNLPIDIPIPEHDDPQSYYLLFQADTLPGRFGLWAGNSLAHPENLLLLNGAQEPGSLAYSGYQPVTLGGISLPKDWLSRLSGIGLESLFFMACGSLIVWLWGWTLPGWGFSAALALSLFPGLLFLLSLTSLPPDFSTPAKVLVVILVLAAGGGVVQYKRGTPLHRPSISRQALRETLLVAMVFLAAAALRVVQFGSLIVPAWKDGIFHAQLLAGFAESAYIPIDLNYPFGVHANAYLFSLLTGLPLYHGLLLTGLFLNLLAGWTVFDFTRQITRRFVPALLAAGLYWSFAQLPLQLINWSRFPFQLGLVLLLPAVWASIETLRGHRESAAPAAILIVGLALTHYSSLVIWAVLTAAGAFFLFRRRILTPQMALRSVIVLGAAFLVWMFARLAIVFWWGNPANLLAQYRTNMDADSVYLLASLLDHGGWLLACGGLLGAAAAARKHPEVSAIFALGIGGITVLGWPIGVWVVSPSNLLVFLALPFSIFSGLLADVLIDRWADFRGGWRAALTAASIALLLAAGGWSQTGAWNPQTQTLTPADLAAFEWIKQNTPPEAVFLVNLQEWENGLILEDGGAWVTDLTGRWVLYASEKNLSLAWPLLGKNPPLFIYERSLKIQLPEGWQIEEALYQADGIRISRVAQPP